MTDLHPLDERPREHPDIRMASSVRVTLVWASGRTETGYFCHWTGWVFDLDGFPSPVDNEAVQPVGWRYG